MLPATCKAEIIPPRAAFLNGRAAVFVGADFAVVKALLENDVAALENAVAAALARPLGFPQVGFAIEQLGRRGATRAELDELHHRFLVLAERRWPGLKIPPAMAAEQTALRTRLQAEAAGLGAVAEALAVAA